MDAVNCFSLYHQDALNASLLHRRCSPSIDNLPPELPNFLLNYFIKLMETLCLASSAFRDIMITIGVARCAKLLGSSVRE